MARQNPFPAPLAEGQKNKTHTQQSCSRVDDTYNHKVRVQCMCLGVQGKHRMLYQCNKSGFQVRVTPCLPPPSPPTPIRWLGANTQVGKHPLLCRWCSTAGGENRHTHTLQQQHGGAAFSEDDGGGVQESGGPRKDI